MRSVTQERRQRRSRLAAAACLAAFLASLSWGRLLALLLVALADGSHAPVLSARSSGLSLVLHHRRAADSAAALPFPSQVIHRHGLAADLLLVVAEDSLPDEDHVLCLGESCLQLAQSAFGTGVRQIATGCAFPASPAIRHARCPDPAPASHPRPPPGLRDLLAQLRVVILLI